MSETRPVPEEAKKALDKCKIQLMARPDSAFFTTVCFSLKHIWDWNIPTACTNGEWIRYNPDFFMQQTPAQQLGLMLHETFHVIWVHMARQGSRDHVKWNVATDFVINLLIKDRGFELPKGALLDEKYRGMSADEVYKLLPDPDPNQVEIHFTLGSGEPGQDPTPEEAQRIEQHIQDVLVRAQIQSKIAGDKPGTIPGEIELYIQNLLRPKLPTATLLRRFLFDMNKEDYSWKKPNRRYFPQHHLPSLYSEALGHIAVAVDASGSVTDDEFKRFVSEVGGIIKQMRPKKISLITFDTCIRSVNEVHTLNELVRVKFTGRGGTAIAPVLEWTNANQPKVILVFTDGHFYFHESVRQPKTPLVWLINDNDRFKAPFGRVLHYESD